MDYTVIVQRPPHLRDGIFDLFFAHVSGDTVIQAQERAIEEAWVSDQPPDEERPDTDSDEAYDQMREYSIVAVFEGHLYDQSRVM